MKKWIKAKKIWPIINLYKEECYDKGFKEGILLGNFLGIGLIVLILLIVTLIINI
jgi:hypothetical protein